MTHNTLKGLAGDVTRVEKCLKCGKLVRSDRMDAHFKEHLDTTRGESREEGVQRIERIFSDLEHYTTHGNDPDCPECQRVSKRAITLQPVRSKYVTLTSGAVTILGSRKKPYDKNAWRYTVVVAHDGDDTLVGSYDTEKRLGPHGGGWWHNEGSGYDEGGNNRAGYLLHFLLDNGILDSRDIEGTRDIPLYRVKSGPDFSEEP